MRNNKDNRIEIIIKFPIAFEALGNFKGEVKDQLFVKKLREVSPQDIYSLGKEWNKAKKYAEELCKEYGVKQHTFDRTSENKRYGNRFGKDTIYKKILELTTEEV